MLVHFDYALHDRTDAEDRILAIAESAGIEIDDELAAKIGRPFYEVTLFCVLDTETGAVIITGTTKYGDDPSSLAADLRAEELASEEIAQQVFRERRPDAALSLGGTITKIFADYRETLKARGAEAADQVFLDALPRELRAFLSERPAPTIPAIPHADTGDLVFHDWAAGHHWIMEQLGGIDSAGNVAANPFTEAEIVAMALRTITDYDTLFRALEAMGWTIDRLAELNTLETIGDEEIRRTLRPRAHQ
jgi:hypothetical protein